MAVDPGNGHLHTNYGIVLLSLNRPAQALAHFQSAMALSRQTGERGTAPTRPFRVGRHYCDSPIEAPITMGETVVLLPGPWEVAVAVSSMKALSPALNGAENPVAEQFPTFPKRVSRKVNLPIPGLLPSWKTHVAPVMAVAVS